MELLLPNSFPVTLTAVIAFVSIFAAGFGVYFRLSGQIAALITKVDAMVERNKHADIETDIVKKEQAAQKTAVAVMAVKLDNVQDTLGRIDRNIEGFMKERTK